MDGFNDLERRQLRGTQFDRAGLPDYWDYADRFVLADHCSLQYGPTLPSTCTRSPRARSGSWTTRRITLTSPGGTATIR
jgi:hypothetical protein